MDFSNVCRTCLRMESLNPIFKDEDDHDRYSRAVFLATGIQVLINDDLPQNMCFECIKLINSTLKFRKRCKNVETELLRIKYELKTSLHLNIEDNIRVVDSHDVGNTGLLIDINMLPKIDLNNIPDIKLVESTDNIIISAVKTEEFEHHNINMRKNSLDITNHISDALYNNNEINMSDDEMKTCEIEIKNTEESTFIRTMVKKVNLSDIPSDKSEHGDTDTFLNDIETNVSDNDIAMGNEQLNITRKSNKQSNYNQISFDETENVISNNESNKIDSAMITETKPKTKRKTTKRVNLKPLNRNTECIPYKKSRKGTTNGTVENEKTIDLPYNVLPGGKCDKITRVVCKMCGKELSIRSIDSHVSRCHPGADQRKVKCELCDRHVMKEKLKRHVMMMHGGAYRCGYCKSEFDGRLLLVEHVKKCTAKKRRSSKSGREMTECDECHQKMQKASLRMHKATKHAGLRPVCEHCGKSYGNKLRLSEHRRAKHGYEKFRCSCCEFTSASAAAMRNHERRHRGEKPFVCEACGASFHAAYLLAQHRHSHRTEKTVTCEQCPARFKAANSLHAHRATCHSARAFRCGLCARAYRCRHYALRHARHAHRGAAPPPLLRVLGDSDAQLN